MGLDAKLLRFAKAQAGAALAFPLGFFGTAISLRAEVGALLPWGRGFASQPTCISDRCAAAVGKEFSFLRVTCCPGAAHLRRTPPAAAGRCLQHGRSVTPCIAMLC